MIILLWMFADVRKNRTNNKRSRIYINWHNLSRNSEQTTYQDWVKLAWSKCCWVSSNLLALEPLLCQSNSWQWVYLQRRPDKSSSPIFTLSFSEYHCHFSSQAIKNCKHLKMTQLNTSDCKSTTKMNSMWRNNFLF